MKKKLLVFAALLVLVLACASVAFAKDVDEGAYVNIGELDEIAKVGGHERGGADWIVDSEPTCTEPGVEHFVCNVMDEKYPTTHNHYVRINPLGHKWSSESGDLNWGKVIDPPKCDHDGLAIDVCTVCGATDADRFRIIHMEHEYDMSDDAYINGHADLIEAPSCGEDGAGKAWRTCVFCGERMPKQADESHLVEVAPIPHNWSDWRVDLKPTCAAYGKASRTCIACGATQDIAEGSPVQDQGKEITVDDVKVDGVYILKPLNPNYVKLKEQYDNVTELNNDLSKAVYTETRNWLKDCYTRELDYACPYCLENGTTTHEPFTVKLVKPATIAHVFEVAPDGNDDDHSLAPTCTKDGYYLYLCKYDKTGIAHGHDLKVEDDRWYKVVRPKLDHDWEDKWTIAQIYYQGEQAYAVSFRTCKRCGAYEQKTEEYNTPEVKQGLILDDDGVWRYYIDGVVAEDFTDIVPFQGGEFWVVNGEVPADANGMIVCPDGQAYFLSQGQIQRVTQWAEYNGEWFILEDGELADVTGLEYYDGGLFAVESGRKLHVNGLWQDPNNEDVWVFLADGQLVDYTGVVIYDGAEFYVENGYLVEEDDEEVDG